MPSGGSYTIGPDESRYCRALEASSTKAPLGDAIVVVVVLLVVVVVGSDVVVVSVVDVVVSIVEVVLAVVDVVDVVEVVVVVGGGFSCEGTHSCWRFPRR
jgi:hypothetical protein